MQDLSEEITSLLYERDCVVVPGLGAFLTRRVSSRYDDRQGLMLPPRKELAFNAELTHEDALLADRLRQLRGLEYKAAQALVSQYVQEVRARLRSGQAVRVGDLGELRGPWERRSFTPADKVGLDPDNYGLGPVRASEVKRGLLDIVDVRLVKQAASWAAVVAALLLISTRTADPTRVQADIAAPITERPAASVSPDGEPGDEPGDDTQVAPAATAANDQQTPRAESVEHSVMDNTNIDEAPQQGFHVVVASFLTRQEAVDYISSMRAMGRAELAVLDYGGRCRISAARFDRATDAQKACADIRKIAQFDKAWVLEVR